MLSLDSICVLFFFGVAVKIFSAKFVGFFGFEIRFRYWKNDDKTFTYKYTFNTINTR